MSKVSRRNLAAGAAEIPSAGAQCAGRTAESRGTCSRERRTDSLVAEVRAWIRAKEAQDALMARWRDLEHDLSLKIKPLKMNLTQAGHSGLVEARHMRALVRRMKAIDRKLERAAGRIVRMRPNSPEGALAKIEMGLRIQGPYDWEEFAYSLVHDGVEQLALHVRA